MLISEEQLGKAMDSMEDAMVIIRQHVKDEAALAAIRRKLILSIVTIVPDAGSMPIKKS